MNAIDLGPEGGARSRKAEDWIGFLGSAREEVRIRAARIKHVLVYLDGNHGYDHALSNLEAYAPPTSVGNYCVAFRTLIDDMPAASFKPSLVTGHNSHDRHNALP